MIDKSVEAFVHPGISSLIGTHNHREPVMAKLMVGNSPQPIPFAIIATEVQAGIFHSSDISGHVYGHRIGIFVPPFRVMFYRSFAVFCGSSPSVLSITFLWISGLGQGFFTTRKVDFGGIPDKCFGRAKSHIPRVLYAKFPSKCSFLFWTCGTGVVYLFRAYNINRFVALACLLHPVLLLLGQDFFRID